MKLRIKKKKRGPRFLNRYTTLPILIDMLWRKQIALLSPDSWEDRNDAYYLERYQQEKKLGAVLALCFSTKSETFHHWRVFSGGSSGVCVEFDGTQLLDQIHGAPGYRCAPVIYSRIDELEINTPPLERWPFLKRLPFSDESEFRVIFESASNGQPVHYLDFDISAVKRVTLSPWMPKSVAESVTETLKAIPDCAGLYVHRSSLIENGRWKKAIDKSGQSHQTQVGRSKKPSAISDAT